MDPLQQQTLINNLIGTTYEKVLLPNLKKLNRLAKDEIEKFRIDWNKSFREYLTQSYNKYSKIKTVLFNTEPKFIYEIFEPPTLNFNGKLIQTEDVKTILKESNFLIIKGEGGIGKSTLLKHFFINTIKTTEQIPIFLELLELNNPAQLMDISSLVTQKLSNLGCSLKKEYLEYALKTGCFVFFLDGYDELIESRRQAFYVELGQFCDKYPDNYYVMTSRPFSEFVEYQRFTILTCERLKLEQAISLITRINPYDQQIKGKFIIDLKESLFGSHYDFASNPLLLNIMFLTYDKYAEVPAKRHIFYDYAYETMYQLHDATKSAFKRTYTSGVPSDIFKKIFAYLCFISYSQGKFEMSKEEVINYLSKTQGRFGSFNVEAFMNDLINAVCILFKDGLVYKFIHRSFQEYFVALFLKELPDDDLTRIAQQIIQKYHRSFIPDDVLLMLRDMAEFRFEKGILIPYLKKVEENFGKSLERYDQYFNILFGTFTTEYKSSGFCITPVSIKDWFLDMMGRQYTQQEQPDEIYIDPSLLGVALDDARSPYYFDIVELKESGLYDTLKTTWIGSQVRTLTVLLEKTEDKLKTNSQDTLILSEFGDSPDSAGSQLSLWKFDFLTRDNYRRQGRRKIGPPKTK